MEYAVYATDADDQMLTLTADSADTNESVEGCLGTTQLQDAATLHSPVANTDIADLRIVNHELLAQSMHFEIELDSERLKDASRKRLISDLETRLRDAAEQNQLLQEQIDRYHDKYNASMLQLEVAQMRARNAEQEARIATQQLIDQRIFQQDYMNRVIANNKANAQRYVPTCLYEERARLLLDELLNAAKTQENVSTEVKRICEDASKFGASKYLFAFTQHAQTVFEAACMMLHFEYVCETQNGQK